MNPLGKSNHNLPWAAQDELYAELSKVSSVAALSPQERILYDETLRQYRDNLCMYSAAYEDGKEEGWKKGKEEGWNEGRDVGWNEGKNEGKEEIARNMLASGCSTELIMQCTGFSKEKIETLECPTE